MKNFISFLVVVFLVFPLVGCAGYPVSGGGYYGNYPVQRANDQIRYDVFGMRGASECMKKRPQWHREHPDKCSPQEKVISAQKCEQRNAVKSLRVRPEDCSVY